MTLLVSKTKCFSKSILCYNCFNLDLDSIISAFLFAYLAHQQNNDILYVPLIKVPKIDLELRPELKFVMDGVGVDYKQLITVDEIDISHPTDIVLVDHNELTKPLEKWGDHVIGVLDHHVDENLYLNAPIRVIKVVGSCVTLVLQHFDIRNESAWLDEQVAKLAMAPILVDTGNLKEDTGKTTASDIEVNAILQQHVFTTQQDTTTYYKAIKEVKNQVDGMSSNDILRRDYKEFSVNGYNVGTSAVNWNFDAWQKREHGLDKIAESALDYAKKGNLDLEVITTSFDYDPEGIRGGDYRRELAVFVVNRDLDIIKTLLEQNQELGLTAFEGSDHTFYYQKNIKMSRKQVWPLIKSLIEQQKGKSQL